MTNLLFYIAIATIFVLIIILAQQFKDKNKLRDEVSNLQDANIKVGMQLTDLKTSNFVLDNKLKDANATIEETQLLNEQQYKQIVEERTKKEEQEQISNSIKKQVEVLKHECESLTSKHKEYLETITQLAQENATLKEQIDKLTKQIIQPRIETKVKKKRLQ